MAEWNKISKKPENDQQCLVSIDNGVGRQVDIAKYDLTSDRFYQQCGDGSKHYILKEMATHWMPLPEDPSDEFRNEIIIKMINGDEFQEQKATTTSDSRFIVVWTKEEPKDLIGYWFADGESTQIDMARAVLKQYYGPAFPVLDIYHECAKSDSKKVRKYVDKVHEYIMKAYELTMTLKAMELKAQEESQAKDSDGQQSQGE